MNRWFNCMFNSLGSAARVIFEVAVILALGALLLIGLCLYGGGTGGLGACLSALYEAAPIAVLLLGAAAIIFLVLNGINCYLIDSTLRATGDAGATSTGKALNDPLLKRDCEWARNQLRTAQSALATAIQQRDVQANAVNAARSRLQAAIAAEAGAVAAVAAATLRPWLLAGALTALAAATGLTAARSRQLAETEAILGQRQAEVARRLADVAAAEALVLSLCGPETKEVQGGVLDGNLPKISVTRVSI